MADYAIPKSGVAYIFYGSLVSQADTKLFKSAPTLAAGDFKVSIDGGAFANLATLPTNTPGTFSVKFSMSAAEMTGDNILVVASDAAGAEWCDQCWNIQTSARGIADLAFPVTSGRGIAVDASNLVAVPTTQKVDVETIKTNPVVNAGTITFPTTATLASTTNITAGTITTVTNLTNAPTVGDLTTTMKASVNTEVLDTLATDTYAEPGQGAPSATTSLAAKINYLYKAWRNKTTQTATTYSLLADDAVTVDQKAAVSDDGTTYSKGEVATGP